MEKGDKLASIPLPLLVGGAAAAALIGALFSQYVFGLNPCVLCIYQRIPYAIIIALALVAWRFPGAWFVKAAVLLLVAEMGIALFHMGVEWQWWQGTDKCGAQFSSDAEALKAQIFGAPVARCDEPPFVFFGLSMAGWNFVYAWVLAMLSLSIWRQQK